MEMNLSASELEIEANDLVLMLDSFKNGAGPRAFALMEKVKSSKIRPELLRQAKLLRPYVKKIDASMALGRPPPDPGGMDSVIVASDARILKIWEDLVLKLREIGKKELEGIANSSTMGV